MNNDGYMDIIIVSERAQNIVYINDGTYNFTEEHFFGPGNDSSYGVALGDVNQDGFIDIVVANAYSDPSYNAIYLNDGNGYFFTETLFGLSNEDTYGVAIGDIDSDGDLDIVAANRKKKNFVYFNDGSGNFSTKCSKIECILA